MNRRFLVIEDNEGDYWQLRDTLLGESSGADFSARLNLSHVRTLAAGLLALSEGAFDIILLDLSLPDCAAPQAVKQILAIAQDSILVVMGTGCVDGLVIQSIEDGAHGYIIKGRYRRAQLLAAISCAEQVFINGEGDELARRQTRARQAFQAILAEELSAPLVAILDIFERALSPSAPSIENQRALYMIRQNGRRLLSAIHQGLAVSFPGAELVQRRPAELMTLLRLVESFIRYDTEQRGMLFQVLLHYPLPTQILTDPVRFKQVLVNAIGAVLELSQGNPVTLSVFHDEQNNLVAFDVGERTLRPSEEQRQEIISALTAKEELLRARDGGAYHNLGIARMLANRLGGDVSFRAEQFGGITLSITAEAVV